jgi:hypothetical protein
MIHIQLWPKKIYVPFSGIWHHVVWQESDNDSEELVASKFCVGTLTMKAAVSSNLATKLQSATCHKKESIGLCAYNNDDDQLRLKKK